MIALLPQNGFPMISTTRDVAMKRAFASRTRLGDNERERARAYFAITNFKIPRTSPRRIKIKTLQPENENHDNRIPHIDVDGSARDPGSIFNRDRSFDSIRLRFARVNSALQRCCGNNSQVTFLHFQQEVTREVRRNVNDGIVALPSVVSAETRGSWPTFRGSGA